MRPAPYHRESRRPAAKPAAGSAPTAVGAPMPSHDADASADFATRVAQARRDACRNPAGAAMLLRSWMSDRG